MNECGRCGLDFTSVEGFDKHRVGVHDYTFEEGQRMDPPREDGRRCLVQSELEDMGFARDGKGRFYDPARTRRAGSFFRPPALGRSPKRAT